MQRKVIYHIGGMVLQKAAADNGKCGLHDKFAVVGVNLPLGAGS